MTQEPQTIQISPDHRFVVYKAKRIVAYALVCAEQFTQAFWRIFFWTLFFCGLWMLQVPAVFDKAGLYTASALFAAGLFYFLYRDVRNFKLPREKDINRRLESESGLMHRPISEQDDTPGNAVRPETWQLWLVEKKRREDALSRVRIPRWRAYLSGKDPYGLRLIAAIIFLTGYFIAGGHATNRIIQGVIPLDWYGAQSNLPPIIVTITPPEYTNLPEKVLQSIGDVKDIAEIPVGSRIRILMADALAHPYVVNNGKKHHLEHIEDGGYERSWKIGLPEDFEEGETYTLQVKQFFFSNLSLTYRLIPDHAPSLAFQELSEKERGDLAEKREKALAQLHASAYLRDLQEGEIQGPLTKDGKKPGSAPKEPPPVPTHKEPKILVDGQIQFPLTLRDDYGVKTLGMTMALDPLVTGAPPLGYEEAQERSVMSPAGQDFKIAPVYDFTHNPWAGLPVVITLTAIDQTGQESTLDPVSITLPERAFKHPVALQLVDLRKQLAWNPLGTAASVQGRLLQIVSHPQDFENDPVIYLALRVAAARLHYSGAEKDSAHGYPNTFSVMSILWDSALRIEDGNLSIAARNLRYANMALEDALRDPDMNQERIPGLMNEMKQALEQYLSEFEKELRKQFAQGEELLLTPEMLKELMPPEALEQFLDQMEGEIQDGNKGKAQQMLSQLQRMLDMLNPNMTIPIPADMRFMEESVSELQQLIDQQKALLAQTEEQNNIYERLNEEKDFGNLLPPNMDLFLQWGLENLPPPPTKSARPKNESGMDTAENATEQEALRYVLGQLMMETDTMLGKIPEKMGLAEREMSSATGDLKDSRPDQSIPHQEKAIEYLSEAQKDMQDELSDRLQEMTGGDSMEGGAGEQFSERFGQRPQGPGQFDPLGRPLERGQGGGEGENNSPFPDSNVKIPDEAERKRVEEILRILRDRSGEMFRPREELEYFRRLLRQF